LAAQGEEDGREVEEEEDGREAAACFLAAARPTGGEGGAREDGRGSWGKNEREKDVGLRVWGARGNATVFCGMYSAWLRGLFRMRSALLRWTDSG
jgi:hypothetical protein